MLFRQLKSLIKYQITEHQPSPCDLLDAMIKKAAERLYCNIIFIILTFESQFKYLICWTVQNSLA